MSRTFGVSQGITFSVGNAPADQGPITLAALVRPSVVTGTIVAYTMVGKNAGADVWALLAFDGTPFMNSDFTTGGPALTVNDWYWIAATKASGSSVPRWHAKDITAGSAWSHGNASGTVADGTGPIDSIVVGNLTAADTGSFWRGEMAALATWGSVLSDGAIEAACTLAASDLAAASPNWGILLDQASTATPVTDFTGGGGNQTAIAGTAVDADDPPGWSYALTVPGTSYVGGMVIGGMGG